ncbi:MAG: nucleotide pyrophosphohydrolase [Epsilonproteobacteria bacterium]|nr:nucleotide pyrophosphohydrolase [Campylobacterota bacterium]
MQNDNTTTISELKKLAIKMASDRDWQKFHSPKNLAMDLGIEASELMEKFVWSTTEQSYQDVEENRQEIEDEAADVLIVLLLFCHTSRIDVSKAMQSKLEEIKAKYPIEKAKGVRTKYTKL